MAFDSEFFFENLTDFWDNLRSADRDVVLGLWSSMQKLAANLTAEALQTNQAKSLNSIPVTFKTLFVPFVFNDKNKNTTDSPPSGFTEGAFNIDSVIVSIPEMLDAAVNDPDFNTANVLVEDTDYKISGGVIFWSVSPPEFTLAPLVNEDRGLIQKNFGSVVGLEEASSETYLSKVRGAWFALWNGPSIQNTELIVAIPLGFPFSEPGTILSIVSDGQGGSDVTIRKTIDGKEVTVNVPSPLGVTVEVDQVLDSFQQISDAVKISDIINNPGFTDEFGLSKFARFFTFVPVIDSAVVTQLQAAGQSMDFDTATDLLEKIKPAYTDCFIGITTDFDDEADMVLFTEEDKIRVEATASFNMNYVNWMAIPAFEADPSNLNESTYSSITAERRQYDIGEDTIGIRDRFIVKDLDTGGEIAGDDPPVGYGINYGAYYGG